MLAIPIIWLVLQASNAPTGGVFTVLVPIILLSNLVIANIIYKTHYKPYQQPYQHKILHTEKRIQQTLASGAATMFAIGILVTILVKPLPNHFWVFLVIFFAIGAIIGDTLQIIL